MPFIKISGISEELVCKIEKDLSKIVSDETNTPKERIRVFYSPLFEYLNGEKIQGRVMIDIEWLPRPFEMRKNVSEKFIEYFEKIGIKSIRIYFRDIDKDYYFTK